MNNNRTITNDINYITGDPNYPLYSAEMHNFPRLTRTVVSKSRADHQLATTAVFAGNITTEDKRTLASQGGLNPNDVPDNLTDALNWRGKRYLVRRYLLSIFFRWFIFIIGAYATIHYAAQFPNPDTIDTPMDILHGAVALVISILGLFGFLVLYGATGIYGLRLVTLALKRQFIPGAQLWLAMGNPLDPIRWWTRRSMLSIERAYTDSEVLGQTAHLVLTDDTGNIIRDENTYHAVYHKITRYFPNAGGTVSSATRMELIESHAPTAIAGGVSIADGKQGTHVVLYVLGVGGNTLAHVDTELSNSTIFPALMDVQSTHPHVAGARLYFHVDPQLYDMPVNNSDDRRKWYD